MDLYKPEKVEGGYFKFLLKPDICPSCNRFTLTLQKPYANVFLFPAYFMINQESQMKAANIIPVSAVFDSKAERYLCKECADAGRASFVCALCKTEKPTSEIHETIYGSPGEFFCKACYATVPAKTWEEKLHELNEKHRYDFE